MAEENNPTPGAAEEFKDIIEGEGEDEDREVTEEDLDFLIESTRVSLREAEGLLAEARKEHSEACELRAARNSTSQPLHVLNARAARVNSTEDSRRAKAEAAVRLLSTSMKRRLKQQNQAPPGTSRTPTYQPAR
jgi:hypothetical protein